ncbi:MAG TPA: class I SAM-dependent methyltransferase [Flexivirga sp.]|uniref:class I SAM-dependent methyltransferase n=1 Tax=Flexivirga sp. TaxID=1962927 RepID=UPI002C268B03|nr:class I SAM-dependent methyltransferase [Flexivirga sp.]HWC23791.1 class I SAM-dependent methyltransferase [Flexivirga sp.]
MAPDHQRADEHLHLDRARAESFGAVATEYDEHRPTYPEHLIAAVLAAVAGSAVEVLDVGSGTGIAARQLRAAGANVLAVEPDPAMARLAGAAGMPIDVATFEEWDPAGRSFDVISFAQSFHWVDPQAAARKAWDLLHPGGALALYWNRFTELDPPRERISEVDARHLTEVPSARPSEEREESVDGLLRDIGFTVERLTFREERRYSRDAWLDLLFTYSRYLVLDPDTRARARADLAALVGPEGVRIENDALLVLAHKPA